MFAAGEIRKDARQFDQAIEICKKVANENPTVAQTHFCLAYGYWGKRMYAHVIEEFTTLGQLSGERNTSDVAYAREEGFRPTGWNGAVTKAIAVRKQQRKTGYSSA